MQSLQITSIIVILSSVAVAAPANAQTRSRVYAGALVGGYSTDADHVDGNVPSVGVTGGMRVLPWLDVEVDVIRPEGLLTREYTARSMSFSGPGPPEQFVLTRSIKERRVGSVISAGVVFHPAVPIRRLTPRVFAGVVNHHLRDRTVLEHLYLPPGVTPEQVNRALPEDDWRTRNIGGPTFGGSLAIAITPHLTVAPDIRYDYGSIGDEINNMLRTSIRVLWNF